LNELVNRLAGVRADIWPNAVSVLKLAQDWLQNNKPLPAEMAQPVYLRNNVAQKSKPRIQEPA
jgi:tRNA A37 threonylcarbamoyladenosine modification protein TsaB